MSYGFSAEDNYGTALIDDEYSGHAYLGRYQLTQKVSVTGLSAWTEKHLWYCDISTTSRPLVFLKIPIATSINYSSPGLAIYSIYEVSTNVWRVLVLSTAFYTPTGYRIYAFSQDKTLGPSADTHGMRIWNSNSDLIFDSGHKRLDVARWGSNYTRITYPQPFLVETEENANDDFFYSSYTLPTGTADDALDIGSYITNQGEMFISASGNGGGGGAYMTGDIYCFPVYARKGRTIYIFKPITFINVGTWGNAASQKIAFDTDFTGFTWSGNGNFCRTPVGRTIMHINDPEA